jgi:hypothetical protein
MVVLFPWGALPVNDFLPFSSAFIVFLSPSMARFILLGDWSCIMFRAD